MGGAIGAAGLGLAVMAPAGGANGERGRLRLRGRLEVCSPGLGAPRGALGLAATDGGGADGCGVVAAEGEPALASAMAGAGEGALNGTVAASGSGAFCGETTEKAGT